jgi:hypothetical protein
VYENIVTNQMRFSVRSVASGKFASWFELVRLDFSYPHPTQQTTDCVSRETSGLISAIEMPF